VIASPPQARWRFYRADALDYQLAVLTGLLLYGLSALQFGLGPAQVAVTLGCGVLTQYLAAAWVKLPRIDPRSALISSLSLCLLLRVDTLWLAGLAAALTIASKFTLRWHGKHLFNPSNFGIVLLLAAGTPAWVSPGQWGNVAWFGLLMACLGGMVTYRALRSDVVAAFVVFYAAILFGRALWLGDPWHIPLHQLQSGALLLFAFFMISDPKTTPDSRAGRIIFALLVALGAAFVQFVLFRQNGLLWALFCSAPARLLLDRWLPGRG
jgi:Na+-transporting NADH:ubiquinone oxidoreductase subunit NqrB